MKNKQLQSLTRRALGTVAVASLCLAPAFSQAETAESALVVGGALNLRQTASLEAKVLGQYPTGTLVEIEEKGDEWCKVTVNGKSGYMMTRYLSQSEKNLTATVRTNTGIGLNMREEPSLSGAIITSYKPGTQITVLQKGISWSRVKMDGREGFMSTTYLNFGGSSSGSGSGSGSSSESTAMAGKVAVVNNPKSTQVLNLRSSASLSAHVIDYYRNGVKVTILSGNNTWYRVQVEDGKVGYMLAKYLKVTDETGSTTQVPSTAKLININGGSVVNFRKEPGMNTTIIRTYPVGTEVTVLETGVNWSKVEIDGVTGYVSSYFLK